MNPLCFLAILGNEDLLGRLVFFEDRDGEIHLIFHDIAGTECFLCRKGCFYKINSLSNICFGINAFVGSKVFPPK